MVLKILALGGFQRVSTSLHAMNFYRNLSLTRVLLLPWNFLFLRNLASYYMSPTAKEFMSLQTLYCIFEILFLLQILLRTLDMVFLYDSSLILHILSSKYLKKVLEDFSHFCTFWLFKFRWNKFSCKFLIIC